MPKRRKSPDAIEREIMTSTSTIVGLWVYLERMWTEDVPGLVDAIRRLRNVAAVVPQWTRHAPMMETSTPGNLVVNEAVTLASGRRLTLHYLIEQPRRAAPLTIAEHQELERHFRYTLKQWQAWARSQSGPLSQVREAQRAEPA